MNNSDKMNLIKYELQQFLNSLQKKHGVVISETSHLSDSGELTVDIHIRPGDFSSVLYDLKSQKIRKLILRKHLPELSDHQIEVCLDNLVNDKGERYSFIEYKSRNSRYPFIFMRNGNYYKMSKFTVMRYVRNNG